MSHSKFFHYFPIPAFLCMQSVGLSIDDSSIRFVEIIDADGEVSVTKHGTIELPPQAIVEGEIINAGAVSAALATMRMQHSARFSRVALPDDKAYVFKLRLPFIPENEIRSALEFKIDENVPLAASEAIFDYAIVGKNEQLSIDVVVCAVARSTSESYDELFKPAGIQPLRFGLESQAVANAVVPQSETGTIFIVNFFPRKTTISIVENYVVQFSLTMRNDELSQAQKGSGNEAEGKIGGGSPEPRRDITPVKQEFERVLGYWQSTNEASAEIHYKVIICGEEALDREFVENFSHAIGAPVLVANPWRNVFADETRVPPISKEESFKYAAAIGLALGHRVTYRHNV